MSEVIIRRLHGVEQLEDARFVCDTVWPSVVTGTEITQNLLTAIEHAGGYVSAAYLASAPTEPVGAVISFLGRHKDANGEWHMHLHSHMAAVLEHARDKNIGTLLKRDQRSWAIETGIDVITWTFDPLVRRNARLNVRKLGAGVSEYLVNFYGDMNDELNNGDESDRFMAWWEVKSPQVVAAMESALPPLSVIPEGAVVVELPDDIIEIRTENAALAAEWRVRVRTQILDAMEQGLELIGLDSYDNYVFASKGAAHAHS
jgi:predicted GNAT superfamily acetyltransferase